MLALMEDVEVFQDQAVVVMELEFQQLLVVMVFLVEVLDITLEAVAVVQIQELVVLQALEEKVAVVKELQEMHLTQQQILVVEVDQVVQAEMVVMVGQV